MRSLVRAGWPSAHQAALVPLPRWVAACTLAETVGMTAAAAAAQVAAGRAPWPALGIVVVGGLVEGTALGTAQGWALRPVLGPRLARHWALVTLVIAGIGWAGASAPAAFAGESGGAEPPLLAVLGAAALLGALMGAVLGFPQSRTLARAGVDRAGRWTGASAVAWAVTMVVIFVGATSPSADWRWPVVVGVGTFTGIVAGAVLGLVSWWLMPAPTRAQGHRVGPPA